MPTIDWSSMTPREVWDALRTAPKVAGPWGSNGTSEFRAKPNGGAWRYASRGLFNEGDAVGWFATRDAADAALRDAGWLLIDDEGG